MNTLWRKVWADLWVSKSRSLLAVISISMGVFCVGTLFGMIDLQLGKMDAAHQQSQASHINLILRYDADLALLEPIKALPGVSGVETMTQLTVYFRHPGASDWTLATLIIRPDYARQRFDKSVLQAGHWPTPGTVAIENLSAQSSGLKPGDNIEFKSPTGSQTLQVDGIVRHPFVKPPKFGGQVHFFASTTDALQFGVAENSFRQLLVQIDPPYKLDTTHNIAGQIRGLLANHQIPVNVVLLQDPQRHWGRPFLAGVNGVLKLMALSALALASVLILNSISAHLLQQIRQIGVMKALGAGNGSIAAIYLCETLLMALLAIVPAIPLGLAAAYFSSCNLLGLFNIDCGGFDYSPRAVVYMIAGGLLVPALAALGPILRSANLTVRVAIADHGLGADFGYSRVDILLERIAAHCLPTLYSAAFCNIFRRKLSLLLTQSVLVIAGSTFLVLMSLIASLNLTLDHEMARSQFAIRLSFVADQKEQQVLDVANALPATERVENWQRLAIEMTKEGTALRQKGNLGAQLLALPSASSLYQPLIEFGRWLQAGDAGKRVLVVSSDTAKLNGIKVGDSLEIALGSIRQDWRVIGIYRWLVAGSYAVEPVYAPLETLRAITHVKAMTSFSLIQAAIKNRAEEADYLEQLKQRFQDQHILLDVYNTQAKLEQHQFTRNQFNPVLGTLLGLAAMIAAVGAIGVTGALAINVMQRTREIGVLYAIGASSKTVYRLFLLEGLLHGLAAWLLSIPLAYLAAEPIARELGKTMLGIDLDFAFDLNAVFYWLGIVLLLTWIASYWPARQAARLTVRECLQH